MKKKKRLKIVGICLGILLLAGGGLIYSVYHNLSKSVESMYTPLDRDSDKRTDNLQLNDQQPFSILLLGVDERDGDSGRSDTMVILTVNSDKKSIKMLSIPRDTYTEIIGKDKTDKINHAYAFGGPEMSMDTVENFLDIPIDYYVTINMEGFKDIIDAIGGITVENTLDFTSDGTHFAKGTLELSGKEALSYSRMRYEDPNGDFGRQNRQRQIIQAVITEGATVSNLTKYDDILDVLSENVETNLSFSEMTTIQSKYRSATASIDQMTIEGTGTKIDGIYYYQVPDEEQLRIQEELKEHLEI